MDKSTYRDARLPTEEEWERAARHTDGRSYPWGTDFDPACANTEEGGADSTTAVCTYPQGVSAAGVWDMSGNVWEWTGTHHEKGTYVLRGGAYWHDAAYARCAVRRGLLPGFDYDIFGLRMVLSLADSET